MENPECDPRRGVRLVGDTWGTGGSPPSLGSPQCDTRLVTAWSPPSKALGLRTPSCRFFSCQDPRRPWLGRGCFLLLCSTRPPETDPSPPSHRQWWHPVASTAGQSVKGPSGKAGALTGSRTSRFYKRHVGQTQACGWGPKARGWKARPRGIRRRNLLTKSFFGRFGVFRWM